MTTHLEATLLSFRRHMDQCMQAILAPMTRTDICVTIVVRAPEALPSEAMITTNDRLPVARDALEYFIGHPEACRTRSAPEQAPHEGCDAERANLHLVRQWFDAVQDLNPAYLEPADFALVKTIYERLGMRVPHSILRGMGGGHGGDVTG